MRLGLLFLDFSIPRHFWMKFYSVLLLTVIFWAEALVIGAEQAAADYILDAIAESSPYPRENYRRYSRKLTQTLATLDDQQLANVLDVNYTSFKAALAAPDNGTPRDGWEGDGTLDQEEKNKRLQDLVKLTKGGHFEDRSDELTGRAKQQLDRIVEYLRRYPDDRLLLRGMGKQEDGGAGLGQKRADAAFNYLKSLGVNPSRIEAKGENYEGNDFRALHDGIQIDVL